MTNLIEVIKKNTKLVINNKEYTVLTKTWYSILEDSETEYIKCELSDNKTLVLIPDDNLIYIGSVTNDLKYVRLNDNQIKYNNRIFNKTGSGHQYIKRVEFGNVDDIEGNCAFEDYESDKYIISLGILSDNSENADVYAEIIKLDEILFEE